jgi:C4-dicarboxylate transporter DctM subunit
MEALRSIRHNGGLFRHIQSTFDRLLEKLCVFLLAIMTISTLAQVFFRYLLRSSPAWTEEFSRWVFVWMIFLGMAVAVRRDAHIRIDMFLLLMRPRVREGFELAINALVVTTCLALLTTGLQYASRTTSFTPALQWELKYAYMAIPVGAVISLYYLVLHSFSKWSSRKAGVSSLAAGVLLYLALTGGPGLHFLTQQSTGNILLVAGLGFLLLGVPVAFALVLSAFLAFWPKGELQTLAAASSLVNAVDAFILLAIPFFIMAGELMNEGGITMALVRLADTLVGHIKGGLGHVSILTNTLMAGLSGSSTADAAGTGKILIPAMVSQGYNPPFAASIIASASVLANIIPPSISMLIYGPLAGVSVGALFMAGVIPGLILSASLMIICYIFACRYGLGANSARAPVWKILSSLRYSLWALGMPLIILFGIRGGIFTATEAASVAALYSLVVGFFVYKGLRVKELSEKMADVMLQTVTIMFIIGASAPFAYLLVIEQVPQMIATQFGSLVNNPALLLLLLNIFLLLVGLPLEPTPAMVILVPILTPIVTAAGINPVHFGIVMIINLMIGSLTPPVGVLIFITAGVSKIPVHQIFTKVIPFELAMIGALLVITYLPFLTLWLPSVIGGR